MQSSKMNKKQDSSLSTSDAQLFCDIRELIEETRSATAVAVNAALTLMYWRVGPTYSSGNIKGRES
jgi:hypothetical protein